MTEVDNTPIGDPDDVDEAGGDFADEHSSTTFADEREGGPEGETEPESPEGYAGMD
jgi:hypothetical protein